MIDATVTVTTATTRHGFEIGMEIAIGSMPGQLFEVIDVSSTTLTLIETEWIDRFERWVWRQVGRLVLAIETALEWPA